MLRQDASRIGLHYLGELTVPLSCGMFSLQDGKVAVTLTVTGLGDWTPTKYKSDIWNKQLVEVTII